MASENTKQLRDDSLQNNPFVSGRAYEVIVGTSGIAQIKTDSPVRGVIVLESDVACTARLHVNRNGYAKIRFTREWEFIERHDFNSAATSADFDSATNLFSEIRVTGYWASGATQESMLLRVNGAASSSLSNCHTRSYQSSVGTATAAGFVCASMQSAAATESWFSCDLQTATGSNRLMYGTSAMTDGTAAADTDLWLFGGKWEDTSTNITSVGVGVTTASNIAAGSWAELYAKKSFDKTKIKLWVY